MRCRSPRIDARRGFGVDLSELGVQRIPAADRGFGVDLRADFGVALRQRGEPFAQRAQVQQRAADEQR